MKKRVAKGCWMTLRIQRTAERNQVVFALAGRIQGEQIPELQDLLKSESSDQNVALDLKEVRLVDRDVVRFLALREAEGTELRNCSAFMREWILRERTAVRATSEIDARQI